ncbi:MAG: glycosidase [Nanoarchaeota archaeon]|nr:glycosidase [Nanoarchaeota archaeon]MCG2718423.1 glycosidase [Nanoarchaeota archaeon]
MKLKRHKQNPIIKPIKTNNWESKAVFNLGAVYEEKTGLIHVIYRAIGEYEKYLSVLGHATSKDGINFERNDNPIFKPMEEYEKWSCEDPRITKIGNTFYMTYVALSKPPHEGGGPPKTALASTTDFVNFKRHGIITPEGADDRDTVLFPEKIDGKYVMLHRPHNWSKKYVQNKDGELYIQVNGTVDPVKRVIKWPIEEKPTFPEKPSIWIAYSEDLKDWYGHKVMMEPEMKWEQEKLGAGPPPIRTEKGWLLIYHSVSYDEGIKKYHAGAALLDLNDPSKVIGRTKNPILDPERDYEVSGDVSNVVFPEGIVVRGDELLVYYGAADKTCCLATCNLNELVNSIQ